MDRIKINLKTNQKRFYDRLRRNSIKKISKDIRGSEETEFAGVVLIIAVIAIIILAMAGHHMAAIAIGILIIMAVLLVFALTEESTKETAYDSYQKRTNEEIKAKPTADKPDESEKKNKTESPTKDKEEYHYNQDLGRLGWEFEQHTKMMFPEEKFEVMHESAHPTDDSTPLEKWKPDLCLKDKETGKIFWIECKYISNWTDETFQWTDQKHLDNYKKSRYQTRQKHFVCIGFGKNPAEPDKIAMINLDHIRYPDMTEYFYKSHAIDPNSNYNSYQELFQTK
ncbi:MAG: hypothetical protein LBJ20_00845 [Candidatus Methanoplasma sp.]|nr:hypothetical protein [Candidatus Methanoplasma sp.]